MKTTHATILYGGNDFFIGITPSGHTVTLDTNKDRAAAPSPMELLLIGVGGCTAVDVVAILKKKREKVTDYRVEVTGERREELPRSFRKMEVRHILTGRGLSEAAVKQAIDLSNQKYCSVAASLRPTVEIVTSYEIHEEA